MTFITTSRRREIRRPLLWAAATRLLGIWRQRQALKTLDEDALRDIGITRTEAEAEARRPFWDAPETWRR